MFTTRRRPRRRPTTRLALEQLGRRDCPSAPNVTLEVEDLPGMFVRLSGVVEGGAPGGAVVTFEGAATGSTTTDPGGEFEIVLLAEPEGQVVAEATDSAEETSEPVTAVVNQRPVVSGLTVTRHGNTLTITGHVADENPAGTYVTLGGIPALDGVTVQVQPDGSFTYTVEFTGDGALVITAFATDENGLDSDLEAALCDG